MLIIAGSRGMAGAAVLCATGAARSGAGLVKLATVRSQQNVCAKRAPLEVTSMGLPEDSSGRLSVAAWPVIKRTIQTWRPHVIAFGPGAGVSPGIVRLTGRLLSMADLRVVLDADGLNALAQLRSRPPAATMVITPHAGELARLLGSTPVQVNKAREQFAKKAALKFRCVCLLKGSGTLVTDGKAVWKNTTGNPAMASGGMGDVLTGIVSALWAQDLGAGLRAAALGAFVHGLAGDVAQNDFPERSMLASDLAKALPAAYKKIWRTL